MLFEILVIENAVPILDFVSEGGREKDFIDFSFSKRE